MKTITKGFALVLALWMTLQCGMLMTSAAEQRVFTEGVVGVINTNYSDRQEALYGTVTESVEAMVEAAEEETADGCLDVVEDDSVPLSVGEALKKQAQYGTANSPAKVTEYHVGDKKVISDGRNVDLVCAYVGKNCTVWTNPEKGMSDADCVDLGQYFDDAVLELWEIFGDKRIDTDGDGKIALFIYDIKEDGVDGFFKSIDLRDEQNRVGNVWMTPSSTPGTRCDCVHLEAHPERPARLREVAVHEYQHYIQHSYCYVGKNNATYVASPQSHVTEGFSRCAEYLLLGCNDAYGIKNVFATPDQHSILHHNRLDGSSYSLDYVFCQYLRIRYAQLTGEGDGRGVYKKILEGRNRANERDTLGVMADLLYPGIKSSDERHRKLIEDFWLAVYLQEKEGIHGFNGEAWANDIYKKYMAIDWQGDSSVVRTGMAAFYTVPTDGSLTITNLTPGMILVQLADYNPTLTLDRQDGTGRVRKLRNVTSFDTRKTEYAPLRYGYAFVGWATTPGATEPDISGVLTLTENKTLYAVWKPISGGMEMNQGYSLSQYKSAARYFTPEADGEYTLSVTASNVGYGICSPDGEVMPLFGTSSASVYTLKGGQKYTVAFLTERYSSSMRIEPTKDYHTLTYTMTVDGQSFEKAVYSFSSFRLAGESMISECTQNVYTSDALALKTGKSLIGWSKTENATEADYAVDSNLEESATLYPVWGAVPTLTQEDALSFTNPGSSVTKYFTFTPKMGGGYQFRMDWTQASLKMLLDDGTTMPISNKAYTLETGKTYFFSLSLKNSTPYTVGVERTSNLLCCKLTFNMDVGSDLVYQNGVTYTIPKLEPLSDTQSGFMGWSTVDGSAKPMYKAGDKITLYEDMNLYPVWSEDVITNSARTAITIRMVFRFLIVSLRIFVLNQLH